MLLSFGLIVGTVGFSQTNVASESDFFVNESTIIASRSPKNPIETTNKEVVRQTIEEALNQGNVDIVDELVAEDAVDNDAFPDQPPGREGFRYHFQVLKTAMPDLNVTFELFADGNTVFEEWVGRGTQTGPLPFVEATGRQVEFPGISIFELENGKIVSRRSYQDSIILLRQLGVVPPEES
jgi:steroid delta-isomerase-like uncharacterized protein